MTIKKQGLGQINYDDIQMLDGHYGIVHVQAPTTDAKSLDSVHPAISVIESTFVKDKYTKHIKPTSCLWHNGIIKDDCVKELQQKQNSSVVWDTALLLKEVDFGFTNLNRIDGSFSCLYYCNGRMYLFRNDISPMFYDEYLNISSTKFEGSVATPPNKVLSVDTYYRVLHEVFEFETVENPYFFGDEIA
jgi:glutamine phosphoribosylpyrophosphate amidotransferase